MTAFVVAYDLMKQGQNYAGLIERLKGYGTYWNVQQSVWIVVTNQTSAQIVQNLRPFLDANDKLLVCQLAREGSWLGYNEAVTQWLRQHL